MKKNYTNKASTEHYLQMLADPSSLPFSFVYDQKQYIGFAKEHFILINKETKRQGDKETQTFTFSFLNTLEVTLILTHYYAHGATEWTVWFENTSQNNSKIIENAKTELVFDAPRTSKLLWIKKI